MADPIDYLASGQQLNNPGAVIPADSGTFKGAGTYGESEDKDSLLYKSLASRHPTYVEWEDKWRIYRDVVDDSDFRKEFYLHRNEREAEDQWRFRVQISEFLPDTPSYVERIVGALYNEKPKRTLDDQRLVEFVELSTLARRSSLSSLDNQMMRVARHLLTYGSSRILVTTNATAPAVSRLEEQQAGTRPYLVIYTPLSVIDWDEDESGELTMARVCERYIRKSDPSDPSAPHVRYEKYIQYDRETARWWVFREDEKQTGKWILDDEGEAKHGLGIVPMIVRYWPDMLKCMVGQSFIRYMARAEVSKFRNDSDMDYDTHMHAHPSLVFWTNEAVKSDFIISAGRFYRMKPGDSTSAREDVKYLEFPTPSVDALKNMIEAKRASVKRYASVDPTGVVDETPRSVTHEMSGVARAWSFGTSESRILSSLADVMADIEAAIFDLVLRYHGEKPDRKTGMTFKGEVQYPEEFEVSAAEALLEHAERAASVMNSPTYLRYIHKRLVRAKAGDAGQDLLDKIFKEIETNPVLAEAVRPEPRGIAEFPAGAGADEDTEEEPEEESEKPEAPARPRPVETEAPARERQPPRRRRRA